MPRTRRIVVLNYPHHITQRGNNKTKTFSDDEDYHAFSSLLEKYKNKYGARIFVYSLMPNHIHIKAVPTKPESFAKTMNCTTMSYTQYFNKKYQKTGHLWQSRFFSCALDQQYAYSVAKYIEFNPVKAGLAQKPENWKWSSARQHLGMGNGIITLDPIEELLDVSDWQGFLAEKILPSTIKKVDNHTFSGMPLGDMDFIKKIENITGMKLANRPKKGRPRVY